MIAGHVLRESLSRNRLVRTVLETTHLRCDQWGASIVQPIATSTAHSKVVAQAATPAATLVNPRGTTEVSQLGEIQYKH